MIRKVFLLHHTHVDIGYTGDRGQVCDDLVAMVGRCTDLIEQHRHRPESERFRWIHEVSWPVLEYLRQGGPNRDRLFEHMRAGLAELTAFYVNPTDLFDRDTFCWSIDRAVELARKEALPLETAMFSDCPGIAWSVPDILAERGIRYLSAAPDFIMSMPLAVERPFYWEGPRGGRVLVWFTDWRNCWYAEGLFILKLHEDPAAATRRLLDYTAQLEREGYRWEALAIHIAMDNQPPLPQLVDFVRHFNSAQSDVQAAMATNRDFFREIEARHGAEFAVHRGGWPDWWANGNASAAYETACSRRAKATLRRAAASSAAFGLPLDSARFARAMESVLMFDEHTWGASTSVKSPWSHDSRKQWLEKRLLAEDALLHARAVEHGTISAVPSRGVVTVANPFDCEFAGPIIIPTRDEAPQALRDVETGADWPGQYAPGTKDAVHVLRVPARSVRSFEYVNQIANQHGHRELANDHFAISYDQETGAIIGMTSVRSGMQLCATDAPYGFAELIHEQVRRGDRTAMYDESKGVTNPDAKRPRPEFVRTAAHASKRRPKLSTGPVFDSLITAGRLPGVAFQREVRLYRAIPRIDVLLRLDKQVVTTYESLYLAFPFAAAKPEVFIENAGAVYRAGIEQLPGSATDWHSVGEYLAVSGGDAAIVLVPHDAPLVQVGDIHTGKWQERLEPHTGHIYSWLMNNMWFTNFPAWQEGEVRLAWSLTVQDGRFDESAAAAFARTARVGVSVKCDLAASSIAW